MQFPALKVRDLEGAEHVIPDGLPGGPHVVILAFEQWHQSLVEQWKPDLEALALRHHGTEVWEVPSISSGYRLFRSGRRFDDDCLGDGFVRGRRRYDRFHGCFH